MMFNFGKGLFAGLLLLGMLVSASANPVLDRWKAAGDLQKEMNAAINAGGVKALAPFVDRAEAALAENGRDFMYFYADYGAEAAYILADGPAEALAVAGLGAKNPRVRVTVIDNPYAKISLDLGSYYNEVGLPDKALAVLDAGLKVAAFPAPGLRATWPDLTSEKGFALGRLHRLPEALAVYDEGLEKLKGTENSAVLARFWRGRGFVLTEMNQLDEAVAAYRTSLELDPGNKIALNELEYLAGLQAGKSKTESSSVLTP